MTRRHTYGTNGRTAAKGRPKRKDESGQEMERLYFKGGRPRGNLGSRAEQEGKTDREREREGGEGGGGRGRGERAGGSGQSGQARRTQVTSPMGEGAPIPRYDP